MFSLEVKYLTKHIKTFIYHLQAMYPFNQCLIASLLFVFSRVNADTEKLEAELTISSLELQDDCENMANIYKSSLLSNTFQDKVAPTFLK